MSRGKGCLQDEKNTIDAKSSQRCITDDHCTHPVCLVSLTGPGLAPHTPGAAPSLAPRTPRASSRACPPTPCRASPAPCHWPRA